MDITLYLLQLIQYQQKQIFWFLNFICRYILLRQWAYDDSHSPKYQKFKIDMLPVIITHIKQDWQFLLQYYLWKYSTPQPVRRRNGKFIPESTICPLCGAPHHFIYDNNSGNGQYKCKRMAFRHLSELPKNFQFIADGYSAYSYNKYKALNEAGMLLGACNMPDKWQLLIFLGQQTSLNLQAEGPNCS